MADSNTDVLINKLIVNRVTKSIYDRLKSEGKISDNELYTITDLSVILDGILSDIQSIKSTEVTKTDLNVIKEIIVPGADIALNGTSSLFKKDVSEATTFTFNKTGLTLTSGQVYTFELRIVLSVVASIDFPSNVTWLNEEVPDLSKTGTYILVFRTYDQGTTWVGNLQGKV